MDPREGTKPIGYETNLSTYSQYAPWVYVQPNARQGSGQASTPVSWPDPLWDHWDSQHVKGTLVILRPSLHNRTATYRPADGRRPNRWVLDPPPPVVQQAPQPVPPGRQFLMIEAPPARPPPGQNPQQPSQSQYQQYQQNQHQQQQYHQRRTISSPPRTAKAVKGALPERKGVFQRRRKTWLGAIAQAIKA